MIPEVVKNTCICNETDKQRLREKYSKNVHDSLVFVLFFLHCQCYIRENQLFEWSILLVRSMEYSAIRLTAITFFFQSNSFFVLYCRPAHDGSRIRLLIPQCDVCGVHMLWDEAFNSSLFRFFILFFFVFLSFFGYFSRIFRIFPFWL